MGLKTAVQGQPQVWEFGAQTPAGQLRQGFGIALPSDQGLKHVPPAFAQHIGRHRGQFQVGCLQHLLQPVGFLRSFLDQGLAVAGQLSQLANGLRGNEAGGE